MALLAVLAALSGCGVGPRRGGGAAGSVAALALRQRGEPYRFGGRSPSTGFDCSGLVQWVFGRFGYHLPREAHEQYRVGLAVPRARLRKGDLVFFRVGRGRQPAHVGLYVGGGRFVHAPSTGERVREDSLSNPYWRRHYMGARRILP